MKLSDRDIHIIVLGVAFVALGGYFAISHTGAPNTGPAGQSPKFEGVAPRHSGPTYSGNLSMAGMSAEVNMLGIDVKGGLTPETKLIHFFDPHTPLPLNVPGQQYTDTCHRYPTVTGTNISTLIHHGYSPLMVPSSRDYEWMTEPPSESYFGG